MTSRNPSVFARPFSEDRDGNASTGYNAQDGIDLRTHVAVKAFTAMITGLYTNNSLNLGDDPQATMAQTAFLYADAFIAERNRPEDEASAKRAAELKAGQELVATARYILRDERRVEAGKGIVTIDYVWDRSKREVVAARRQAEPQSESEAPLPWEPLQPQRVHAYLGDIVAAMDRLEGEIQRDQPYNLEDWGCEATNELPEWAQPE